MNGRVWTVTPNKKVQSYLVPFTSGNSISETISNLHREIVYVFGGFPLDISLNSNNAIGSELSIVKQRLDDKAVIDVCTQLMSNPKDESPDDYLDSASIVFDWVYIQAVLQRFNDNIDLSNFTHFTDCKMQYGLAYSGARAVAALKLLQETEDVQRLIQDFESFSAWHVDNVLDAQDAPKIAMDYKILQRNDDHISIVSRLSRNIFSIVAEKAGMQLWDNNGRYIMYYGAFNNSWINDFAS